MNLLHGALQDSAFVAPGVHVGEVGSSTRPDVVLGIRPEDVYLSEPEGGDPVGKVCSFELTGEAVLVTAGVGQSRICARGDRHIRYGIGQSIGLRLDWPHCYLFDAKTEQRGSR